YATLRWEEIRRPKLRAKSMAAAVALAPDAKAMLLRVSMIVFLTTAVSSIVFQSTTFALPKVFEERLGGISVSATALGGLAFFVFALGSMGQLVVGHYLDKVGPRTVFATAATVQVVLFAMMPVRSD